jgi:phytoene dehydrogenase-like protein
MGPSWYWMPDVFRFFADFGKTTDYYELIKLSPAYRVYYGIDDFITIADNLTEIIALAIERKRCLCRILWLEPKVIMILLLKI